MYATDLFIDLVRVETRLYNAADERMRSVHGLSLGQFQLLDVIGRVPNCRVYDIVQEVVITVGAVSKAVDRLERGGWCRRDPNPDDRRSSILTLTPEGVGILEEVRPTLEEELITRTAGVVTPEELARAQAVLSSLRVLLEKGAAGGSFPRDGAAGRE